MKKLKLKFLVTSIAMGLTVMTSAHAVAAQKIRIAHGASPEFHMHKALLEFERILEQESHGKFDVEVYPSGQIAGDTNMVEAAQSGTVEIAVEPPSFLAKWDAAFEVAELPFIYPNKEIAFEVLESEAGDTLLSRLNDLGLVGLGWMEMGSRHITNNVRPIHTPEDLKGIKLRTMKVPTHIDAFRALGANPTPMNFGEVYAGLQVGVIDGQENPLSHIYTQKFHEVQKYISLTQHVLGLYLPVMNIEFYESLSEDDKSMIKTAMKKAIEYDRTLVAQEEKKYLEEIKSKGVAVNSLNKEEAMLFKTALASTSGSMRERVGADVYDMWISAVEKATN